MATKPEVVFVLGGPGAGKGTQCQKIVKDFGFVHLSAGDLLREERNTPGSQYGELIENHIRNGTIVPVEITCSLLEKAMTGHSQARAGQGDAAFGSGRFLVDGFPRNENNLKGWDSQMSPKVHLKFVLYFDCPEDLCVERCLKRGLSGSGRSDDNEESMRKRIKTFNNDTMPIIRHYEALELVKRVDAARDPDTIYGEVHNLFQ
jgi:UMP-CMP kinase